MILDASAASAIEQAADRLAAGGLVGMPTETVYGLAADADNATAVQSIFSAKERPADHPLIVHVAADDAGAASGHWDAVVAPFAQNVPAVALALMKAFWPGPLTLILPRRPSAVAVAAGGQDSVGLRSPSHPVAQALLKAARAKGVQGLAAPSANRFGRVSPTTAAHVQQEFEALPEDALLVLDGGACPVGIESSIVDCTRAVPVLLRPGMLSVDELSRACGVRVQQPEEAADNELGDAPRASGTLASHYAPSVPVRLMPARQLQSALDVLGPDARHIAVYARADLKVAPGILLRRMPSEAAAAAQELFAQLRALDDTGVKLIWVETPPEDAAWDGVRDRLQRAAA
ncbi:L-threonylcarbamoyladenylate synthase [Hydrogenophaga sp. 5NK40-0174]|uniref:L-threonylcarbamoyladenylate synthase n=1 Tax=Hydrogenophaga sp. 5NK40-0174 TaxID=3127649 RepID=UPI003340F642